MARLIAPPLAYDEIMRQVPHGQVITADHMRSHLAGKHGADFACPLTAGIFINIAAHASVERAVSARPRTGGPSGKAENSTRSTRTVSTGTRRC